MNTVYYGNHAYGVEAAAQTYFSRPAKKLSLLQSALLAGLPQAPSVYDPFENPARAIERAERRPGGALRERRHQLRELPGGDSGHRPEAEARQDLHANPRALLLRLRPRRADQEVRSGDGPLGRAEGLHDDRPPHAAGCEPGDAGDALLRRRPASAIVAIDPRNGAIKTMTAVTPGPVGEPVQPRRAGASPGGLDLQDLRPDRGRLRGHRTRIRRATSPRRSTTSPTRTPEPWDVSTYSHSYLGSTSITQRDARLRQHGLRPADARPRAGEGRRDGAPARRRLVAEDEGGRLRPVPRPRLDRVSPLDMASAYATIAAGGIYSKPMAIRKVVLPRPDGNGGSDEDPAGASRSASA